MADSIETLLAVISALSKPQVDQFTGAVHSLPQVLENNVKLAGEISASFGNEAKYEKLEEFGIDKCHAQDIRWTYSCLCLETLLQVGDKLEIEAATDRAGSTNAPCEPLFLSVRQEKEVAACLQLVVSFGLLPNLLPNIGVPIQKRSKWWDILGQPQPISDEQKYSRLTVAVKALCKLEQNTVLGPKLAAKHLTDVLAGLLQLCHAPISKPTTEDQAPVWQRLHEERLEFVPMLDSLVERSYPPLLVQSLQLLQGPSPSHARVARDALQPAPRWMIRACGRLLTRQLLRPNGLALTIAGIVDLGEITSDTWQRCDSLAFLVSTPPSRLVEKQREYYAIIGPQLADLVKRATQSKELSKGPFMRIASSCYREIASRYRPVAQESVFEPLFRPLQSDDEDELVACVETLHAVFVVGSDPSSFHQLLEPHAERLLRLYRKWCHGVLQVKNLLEDLVVRIIRFNEGRDRVDLLRTLLSVEQSETDEFLDEDERSVTAFLTILEQVDGANDSECELTYSAFVSLLQDLPKLMAEQPSASPLAPDRTGLLASVRRGLVTIKLIGVLSENERLHKYLLDRPAKAVEFARVFLERAAENLDRSVSFDLDLETEGLAIVLAVVGLQMENLAGAGDKSDVWSLFEPLLGPLERLAKKHALERIRNGADELRLAIQTRGFSYKKRDREPRRSEFQSAWEQLSDPLVPVQGHAVLTMSHLLSKKDSQAMEHRDQLLQVFLRSLEHEDSYIYLMSVQALVALSDVYTDRVVHCLVGQLEQLTDPKLVSEVNESDDTTTRPVRKRPPEVRLKVGEALLKVVRLIGPLVPQYKNVLLNALLRGTRDDDPYVRASCLHNLGELCGLLRYSIDSVAHELLDCVTNLTFRDPAVEVRRAAVLLIGLLLNGLDKDALLVLEPIIKDLYRVLKEVVIRDNDDKVVTFHASRALEKLSEIAKQFLTGPRITSKISHQLRLP